MSYGNHWPQRSVTLALHRCVEPQIGIVEYRRLGLLLDATQMATALHITCSLWSMLCIAHALYCACFLCHASIACVGHFRLPRYAQVSQLVCRLTRRGLRRRGSTATRRRREERWGRGTGRVLQRADFFFTVLRLS